MRCEKHPNGWIGTNGPGYCYMCASERDDQKRLAPTAGSVSVGLGQVAAAALWKVFKEKELTYVDMLEAAACLIVNVADKTESTDHEIHKHVWKLTTDMRANATRSSKPNADVYAQIPAPQTPESITD